VSAVESSYPTSLLLFSKSLSCGTANSRLQRTAKIAPSQNARLHRAFVCDALLLTTDCEADYRFAAWYPDFQEQDVPQKFRGIEITHFPQQGTDFAARFQSALQHVFTSQPSNVIVYGSDCPYISPSVVREARLAVEAGAVAIGPSTSGGFYLLGIPFAARAVDTSSCFQAGAELLAIAQAFHTFPVTTLSMLPDVDIDQDLVSLTAWIQLLRLSERSSVQPEYLPPNTAEILSYARIESDRTDTRKKVVVFPN